MSPEERVAELFRRGEHWLTDEEWSDDPLFLVAAIRAAEREAAEEARRKALRAAMVIVLGYSIAQHDACDRAVDAIDRFLAESTASRGGPSGEGSAR